MSDNPCAVSIKQPYTSLKKLSVQE